MTHSSPKPRAQAHPIRLALRLGVGVLGSVAGSWVGGRAVAAELLTEPVNVLYLGVLGFLVGTLIGRPLAAAGTARIERLVERTRTLSPDVVISGTIGATVGLLITVLLDNVLANLPGMSWIASLVVAVTLTTTFGAFFVTNRTMLRLPTEPIASSDGPASEPRLLLDTSAIIDGRLVEVAEANFLPSALVVPAFVLRELQGIADDGDPLRRKRGRRGLDVLERLRELPRVELEVLTSVELEGRSVDDRLVELARSGSYDLLTTDFNLHQVANLQGVRVLNLHRLASALRTLHLPGEHLHVHVERTGKEPGQGLGYLDDGTMIVIEEAAELVGHEVDVAVTGTLQTNVGRMVFAKRADERMPA